MTIRFFCVVAFVVALTFPADASSQRKPLVVEPLTALSHDPTGTRMRYDEARSEYVEYAVEGRIDFIPATGDFLFSWNGADGTRQTMTWEPPNKVNAIIQAEVSFDQETGFYTYSYTVQNSASSKQRIATLYVGGATPDMAVAPDGTWYSRALSEFLKETLSQSGGWAWSQTRGASGISPGQSVSGFEIVSHQPPTVIQCFVVGRTPNLNPSEVPPHELHVTINEAYYRFPAGVTVGPAAPPDPADVRIELEQLLSDLDQAVEQGWLGSPGSASRIRTSITGVRSAALEGRPLVAQDRIGDVLDELDQGLHPDLLSEGRALLEYRLPLLRARIGDRGR